MESSSGDLSEATGIIDQLSDNFLTSNIFTYLAGLAAIAVAFQIPQQMEGFTELQFFFFIVITYVLAGACLIISIARKSNKMSYLKDENVGVFNLLIDISNSILPRALILTLAVGLILGLLGIFNRSFWYILLTLPAFWPIFYSIAYHRWAKPAFYKKCA